MDFETLSLEALKLEVRNLQKEELLLKTRVAIDKENELTAKTLVFFLEIERRLVHLEMGYSSLYDMLMKYFGMSEGSSSRRVASVRIMADVPGLEEKIKKGALSLSNISAAQRFFNAEAKNNQPIPLAEKKNVLESLVGKSYRETEIELQQRSSLPLVLQVPDRIKPKGLEHVEIKFLATVVLADLLEEVRGLLSHRINGGSLAEVIQYLAEVGVEKLKNERFGVGSKLKNSESPLEAVKKTRKKIGKTSKDKNPEQTIEVVQTDIDVDGNDQSEKSEKVGKYVSQNEAGSRVDIHVDVAQVGIGADVVHSCIDLETSQIQAGLEVESSKRTRYIRSKVRRTVYERSQGRCEFTDPQTGKRCNSKEFLQFHHRVAFAKGGENTEEVLQMTCRALNSYHAVMDFSSKWMDQFRKPKD